MDINFSENSKRKNIKWVVIFAAVGLFAHFLPLIDVMFIKVMIYQADWAMITIPLFIIAGASVYIPDLNVAKVVILLAGAIILFTVGGIMIEYASKVAELTKDLQDNPFADAAKNAVKLSFGVYILLIAAVLTMISAFNMKEYLPLEGEEDDNVTSEEVEPANNDPEQQ